MKHIISKFIWVTTVAAITFSCSRASESISTPKFDAGYSTGMDAVISDGVVISSSSSSSQIKREIVSQLYYTMGQLNAWRAVSDLSRATVTVNSVAPLADGLFEAHYSAKLFVSWPRRTPVPASHILVMPAQMGNITEFVEANSKCRDEFQHEADAGNFWYYFRPEADECPLRNGGIQNEDVLKVRRIAMTMSVSSENTTNKYPEYSKVWEDGKLVITAMFGKETAGATDASDAGVSSYNAMYRLLRATLGIPTAQNVALSANEVPGVDHPDVEMEFNSPHGPVQVSIMLLEGVREMTSQQEADYRRRTMDSDMVSYSGHSGLGANIRALGSMGNFQPNQYQIFFVNGCDTFAYVDNALRDAHLAANPGFSPSKFFDIITNSMPSYFC